MSVHAHHPTGDIEVWIEPTIEVAHNEGLNDFKVHEVLKVVRKREAEIRAAWVAVRGERGDAPPEPAGP
jgi:hypothetical protein